MPENQMPVPEPVQPVIPIAQPASNKLKVYFIGGIVLALIVTIYTYINKYRLDEQTITTLNKTVTDTKTELDQKKQEFSDYKHTVESNTSWVDTEYFANGRIKHQKTFNKNMLGVYSGSTTLLSDLTASTLSTTTSTTATTDKKRSQSGVPINGAVFITLPFESVVGKISSLGVGIDHQFIFDTTVGIEAGTNDISNPFGSLYGKFLLGHGIQ